MGEQSRAAILRGVKRQCMRLERQFKEDNVPGGGVVLIRAAKVLDRFEAFNEDEPANDPDEQIGINIVICRSGSSSPRFQIS
jgi:hypothetical protein